jgi:cytochrome c oxidase assembly protein Cox11
VTRKQIQKYGIVAALLMVIGGMTVAVSYSVTLYRLFCSVTGAGGTTQRVASASKTVSDKFVTVYFNTNTEPGLPWKFRPVQNQVRLRLGQDTVVFFEAENTSDQDITGHATFNVTPDKAGIYFKKIECFCFTDEKLAAHQKVEMPVQFFVDPALGTDRATQDVDQITLSYTFFRARKPTDAQDLARFQKGPPDPNSGKLLFASDCSGCHELDEAKVGPPLAGVYGRKAGSVPGYPYSHALADSGVIWSADSLDKWLAGPAKYVPGALMPMAITDPVARRDIIAYLREVSRQQGAEAEPAQPQAKSGG